MSRKKKSRESVFWLSYSDLMTSLFFVMLVLFVLVYSMQNRVIKDLEKVKEALTREQELSSDKSKELEKFINELTVAKKELDRIREIERAVSNIDKRYFRYDSKNKKHILNVDFLFPRGSANIRKIKPNKRPDLLKAGEAIRDLILKFPEEENIKYLVVVEGQASKDNWEGNEKLSYYRARALKDYWEEKGIGLEKLKNCELVIAGSGEKGVPRTLPDVPPANQRFLITIVPKIGELAE